MNSSQAMSKPFFHYLSALAILTIYGGQVCPYLESLPLLELAALLAGALGTQFLIHLLFWAPMVDQAPLERQAKRALEFVLATFATGGMALSFWNLALYDFPLSSGLKLFVGFLALGVFCAFDLSLAQERKLNSRFAQSGEGLNPEQLFFSHPRRLFVLVTSLSALMIGVFFLLISKDLDWILAQGPRLSLFEARRSILIEVLFVVTVAFLHLTNLILAYNKNLALFFTQENQALAHAATGDFHQLVPVASLDEFGLMALRTNRMIQALHHQTQALKTTQEATILALASLAETRDNETGAHILRTQAYVAALARQLAEKPEFAAQLPPAQIDLFFQSAPLHDIGKVGIPDAILLKPGKLTEAEFATMKRHPLLGAEALEGALKRLGGDSFLSAARDIALTHHEKWDGSGYPKGLKGEKIPLAGRLMALADVYDALISKRVYKPAFPHEKAVEILTQGEGSHFDPRLVQAFLEIQETFYRLAQRFADANTAVQLESRP